MRRIAQLLTPTIFLMVCLFATTVQADPIVIEQPQVSTVGGHTSSGLYDAVDKYNIGTTPWRAFLDPEHAQELAHGGTDNFLTVLKATFAATTGWTFVAAANNLSAGSLKVHTYDVLGTPSSVGAEFVVEYAPGAGDPTTNIHWIQVVTTNHSARGDNPGHGNTFNGVDNGASPGGRAPYYDDGGAADTRNFYDFSMRPDADMTHSWVADLYLVVGPAAGTPGEVTIYNGIRWGWRNEPVPEPATLFLLGSGLTGVAAMIRKRRGASRK